MVAKSGAAAFAGGRIKKTQSAAPDASRERSSSDHRPSTPFKKSAGESGGGNQRNNKSSSKGGGGKKRLGNADVDGDEKPLDGVVVVSNSNGDNADASTVIDFGPDDKNADPGGRRAKKEREMKKKLKAGSFGKEEEVFFPSLKNLDLDHLFRSPRNKKNSEKPRKKQKP